VNSLTGGCLCGNLRIVTAGQPYRVGICHCLDCRKHHGALFYAAAVFPQDAVTVEGETAEYAGRHFCPSCGSSVFSRLADEIEVHLGALDAPDQLTPNAGPCVAKAGCRRFRSSGATSMIGTTPTASNERHCPLAISCCSVFCVFGSTRIAMNFDVGVWLRSPKLSSGTSGLVSG